MGRGDRRKVRWAHDRERKKHERDRRKAEERQKERRAARR